MGLTIGIDARQMEFQGESIVIGRSPKAQLSLPDQRLADQHAVLRLVAGRWLIEAQSDGVIRVGDGRPTKVAWLNPGDVIHLTESGPCLIFAPKTAAAAAVSVSRPMTAPATVTPPAAPLTPAALPMAAPAVKPSPKPAATKGPSQEFQWTLGGAVLVLLGVGITVSLLPRGTPSGLNAPSVVTPIISHPSSDSPVVNHPVPSNPPSGSTDKIEPVLPPKSADAALTPSQLAATVHLVLVSAPDRDQTYRLGTAWAVDKRRLVTSGAVGQAIQQLREQLPQANVQGVGKAPAAKITQVNVHPEFRKLYADVSALEGVLDDLLATLESSDEASAAEQLRPQIVSVQDRLFDMQQQMADCDLAVLEVDQDLPVMIPVIRDDVAKVRPGTTVRIIGLPYPAKDRLVDPDVAVTSTASKGQVQVRVPATGTDVRRWLISFPDMQADDNWTGSAVVNSSGHVIGVYTRPMPPSEPQKTARTSAHEVTALTRLVEIHGERP